MAFWPGRSCVHFAAVLCLWAGLPTSKHTQSRWWGGGEAHGECSAVQASPLPLLVPPPPQTPPLGGRAVRRQLRSAGPLGPAVQAATAWAAVGMGRACCCPPGSPHPFCCTPNKKNKEEGEKERR